MLNALTYLREMFRKPESAENPFRYRDILFFVPFVRPLWKLGLISLMLTMTTSGLGSLLPMSSKVFIDFVIMKEGFDHLETFLNSLHLSALIHPIRYVLGSVNLVILLILVIGIFMGVIRMVQNFLILRFQQEITFNIQTALFDRVLRFSLSFLKERQVGYLMSRISSDVSTVQRFFSSIIPQLMTHLFYIFFSCGILFTLNSEIFFMLFALIPIWVLNNYFFGSRVRAISRKTMEKHAQISKDMQEVLTGVEVIKTHVSEKREVAKISAKIRSLFSAHIKSALINSFSANAMQATKLLSILLIVWLSVRGIERGEMTIGDMTALIAYVAYLSARANGLSSTFLNLQSVFAGMERVMEMFEVVPEFEDEGDREDMIRPENLRGDIRFEKVSFAYQEGKPVLSDVSFTVRPGEIVALTGPSGAGKTTLINLMIKFLTPKSGAIFLDAHDLRQIDTRWLRERVGFVSQDIFLFNDTVEANIRYGRPSASSEEVIRAARNAGIHDEIGQFQEGYQTLVGERGVNLSVGQRQRISIARAFLKDPRLLIFDEPTSALDADTESALKDSLKKLAKNRTVFMITHRMSVTDIAGRFFLLERGRIKDIQPKESLNLGYI